MEPSKPGFPLGTFACTTGDVECVVELALLAGTDEHGSLVLTSDGEPRVEGSYRVTGDEVEFTGVAGPHASTSDEQTGGCR